MAMTTQAKPSGPSRTLRVSRRSIIALGAVIVLVAAGLTYSKWRNGATALFSYGGDSDTARIAAGSTLYVNSNIQPKGVRSGHRIIDVHRVTPHLAVKGAYASVQVLLCRVADPHLGIGTELDTTPCAALTRFAPGKIDLGFPATEIIYKVTAQRTGTVHITGADVSYSVGGRNGAQHAGSGVLVHVKRAAR